MIIEIKCRNNINIDFVHKVVPFEIKCKKVQKCNQRSLALGSSLARLLRSRPPICI